MVAAALPNLRAVAGKYWWTFVLRGVLAILFGVLAFTWPGVTLASLVMLYGAYALIEGILSVFAGISEYGERERWWMEILGGVVSIAVGILTFVWPGVTTLALLYMIAFWAIFRGVLEIMAAIRLRKVIEGEWFLVLAGVCYILFGILLISKPGTGILSLLWAVALFACIFGLLLIVLGFKVKAFANPGS